MESENKGNHAEHYRDSQNSEEFINSTQNPNDLTNPENLPHNLDTDPNRYSSFSRDDSASDGSDNIQSPANDAEITKHNVEHYSVEDERNLGKQLENSDKEDADENRLSEDDKDGFFEGL